MRAPRVTSKNSKANRIETGERSGGIRRNLFGGSRRKIACPNQLLVRRIIAFLSNQRQAYYALSSGRFDDRRSRRTCHRVLVVATVSAIAGPNSLQYWPGF
jgi:hypothetical protein